MVGEKDRHLRSEMWGTRVVWGTRPLQPSIDGDLAPTRKTSTRTSAVILFPLRGVVARSYTKPQCAYPTSTSLCLRN